MSKAVTQSNGVIHWFRKGLRLHDNPALLKACSLHGPIYPLFILDPKFMEAGLMSTNRHQFLLECLQDLDTSLEKIGSRLFVARGNPETVLPELVDKWGVSLVTFEGDTGPYSKKRDAAVTEQLKKVGCKTHIEVSHTMFPMDQWIAKCGKTGAPKSYGSFCDLFSSMGKPRLPLAAPSKKDITPNPDLLSFPKEYTIPSLKDPRYRELPPPTNTKFPGGETEALRRLKDEVTLRPSWVAGFDKPSTSPNSLEPSTTVLGPYLTMGCMSVARFWHEVANCKPKTKPPSSLHGQLLWREFFYVCSATTNNFDKMEGNSLCKQIPWERNPDLIKAWKDGKTGFPWIDAAMTQLRIEGWIHHLARHAVACFLTRGDLWQHWEEGAKHFEYTLLDGDWAINNANWQWLSCSRFFYQYGRCYSPIAFGKKTDPEGKYIKKWLPKLKNLPKQYIYEPWLAPAEVQKACGVIVGKDYPRPLVDHATQSKENMTKMSIAYKGGSAVATTTTIATSKPKPVPKRRGKKYDDSSSDYTSSSDDDDESSSSTDSSDESSIDSLSSSSSDDSSSSPSVKRGRPVKNKAPVATTRGKRNR